MDMNPLVTPQTCLSDCLNGTIITFNGNEFTLQSDNGNVKIKDSQITKGFVPVGAKEYGGILYLALYNPVTNNCEIGSIPSPDFSKTPKNSENGVDVEFQAINGQYSKVIKLFEKDQMILNPGDEYKIEEIVTNKSPLYKYNYKIFDSNENMYDLKDPAFNKYQPFNHSVSATLGLEIILENIKYFDIYGINYDNILKLYYFGENQLQGEGVEDDIYIKFIKIDIVSNNGDLLKTLNINTSENYSNILQDNYSLTLNEEWGTNFQIIATPVSNYEELTTLSKTLEINLSTQPEIIEGSKLFKYYYQEGLKSLRLEFDYNYNPAINTDIYVEFYDIWSDYSVIYLIENPNPYGKNILYVDTTNERLLKYTNNVSENGTIGGIQLDNIIESNDIFQNFTNKRRTKQVLRENNLYICTIHKVQNNTIVNSIKRPFVLNNYLNDNFNMDDVQDMTILKNKNIEIDVNLNVNTISTQEQYRKSIQDNLNINTVKNNTKYYYKLSYDDTLYTSGEYIENYETSTKLNIKADYNKALGPYGLVEMNSQGLGINVSDVQIYGDLDGASYTFLQTDNDDYTYTLKASRKLTGTNSQEIKNILSHDESQDITLWDTIYTNTKDPYSAGVVLTSVGKNTKPFGFKNKSDGVLLADYSNKNNDPIDDDQLENFCETIMPKKMSKYFSGFIIEFNQNDFNERWYNIERTPMSDVLGNEQLAYMAVLYCDTGTSKWNYLIIPYTNKFDLIDIFKNIYVPQSISKRPVYLNYYTYVKDNGLYDTFIKANLKTELSGTAIFYQYYNKNGNFINASIDEIMTYYGVTYSTDYLEVNTSSTTYSKQVEMPTLTISAEVDPIIKTKMLSSLSDLERQEANSLVESVLTPDTIYSKKNTWEKLTSKFTWDRTKKRFKLKSQNWTSTDTYFLKSGGSHDWNSKNNKSINYVKNYFLNN